MRAHSTSPSTSLRRDDMPGSGVTTVNFGAFPGSSDASIAITGQPAILAGSLIEAWILPAVTADHSADEHIFDTLGVVAGNISAGVGFTIYGVNTSTLNEPLTQADRSGSAPSVGGQGTRLYGQFSVGWVWN